MRILLAEDNPSNERVAQLFLTKLGHTSQTARNGLEALELLRRGEEFDCILMDIQMPEMDGIEATRRICEEFTGGQRPPIIAVTANAFRSDREACFAAGMIGFLVKPLRLGELQHSLETLVGERPEASRSGSTAELEFDFEHFDSVMEGGEEAVEIFDDFCEDTVSLLVEMQDLERAGEGERFARLAHQLKGSFATFGLAALSRQMSRMEEMARSGALAALQEDWMERQREAFGVAVSTLRARL